MNQSNNVQQQTQCKRENTRLRDTRQHLHNYTIVPTGASHKHLHIIPIKKRKRSRDFPAARRFTARPPRTSRASPLSFLAPLVPRASRASRLSSTCASRARAPLRTSSATCASPEHVRLSSNVRFSARLLPRAPRQHVFSQAASALFSHSTLLSQVHFSNVPRPLLGALHPHHQSHGHVTPPPCASRSRDRQIRRIRICCYVEKQANEEDALLPP